MRARFKTKTVVFTLTRFGGWWTATMRTPLGVRHGEGWSKEEAMAAAGIEVPRG